MGFVTRYLNIAVGHYNILKSKYITDYRKDLKCPTFLCFMNLSFLKDIFRRDPVKRYVSQVLDLAVSENASELYFCFEGSRIRVAYNPREEQFPSFESPPLNENRGFSERKYRLKDGRESLTARWKLVELSTVPRKYGWRIERNLAKRFGISNICDLEKYATFNTLKIGNKKVTVTLSKLPKKGVLGYQLKFI
jgi:hypothetical protein